MISGRGAIPHAKPERRNNPGCNAASVSEGALLLLLSVGVTPTIQGHYPPMSHRRNESQRLTAPIAPRQSADERDRPEIRHLAASCALPQRARILRESSRFAIPESICSQDRL